MTAVEVIEASINGIKNAVVEGVESQPDETVKSAIDEAVANCLEDIRAVNKRASAHAQPLLRLTANLEL